MFGGAFDVANAWHHRSCTQLSAQTEKQHASRVREFRETKQQKPNQKLREIEIATVPSPGVLQPSQCNVLIVCQFIDCSVPPPSGCNAIGKLASTEAFHHACGTNPMVSPV